MPDSKKRRWRDLNPQERSILRAKRAKQRSKTDPSYKKFGVWVKSIRTFMKMSQVEFADRVSVSELTIRRWELGWGHSPRPIFMRRLRQMAANCEGLKKLGVDFEKED